MNGLMQHKPLLISSLLEYAERYSAGVEVVSRRVEGDIHRYTWADVAQRSRQLAMVLDNWALAVGSRVASIAWNGYRHLELYYGVSGSQRVLHTINPRLHASQVAWMLEHAEDEVVFFDASFSDLVRTLQPLVPQVRFWVLLGEQGAVDRLEDMPGVLSYETLLAAFSGQYSWPQFDEQAASSLCYTSGTTGNPKGALYSHRSTLLHSLSLNTPSALGIGPQDVVMPVVPMFHVNGWGTPYCTAMAGCKLVLPGPALDGRSVYQLIEQEQVTIALGVPTVWQMLLEHVDACN
ncbi:AMP-binding protein, partial [Pseudomonas sp. NY15364]|uniref:AMP-binding protein n=1 Tax=Pseudomonas sp. NY15364 TaxID=3400353 RepID=UPI003A89C4E2